jgi:hypothetical protein
LPPHPIQKLRSQRLGPPVHEIYGQAPFFVPAFRGFFRYLHEIPDIFPCRQDGIIHAWPSYPHADDPLVVDLVSASNRQNTPSGYTFPGPGTGLF